LESKTPLLGLLDVDEEMSAHLNAVLQEYCKVSTMVCGYARKTDENFKEFVGWLGLGVEHSQIVYVNTDTYDKYLFDGPIAELSIETLEEFVNAAK